MLIRCLCVLSGGYSLGLCHSLPADNLIWAIAWLTAIGFYKPRFRNAAWFLLGFTSMWIAAWIVIDDRLDPAMQGETILLDGRIADFPVNTDDSLRFIVTQEQRPDLTREQLAEELRGHGF